MSAPPNTLLLDAQARGDATILARVRADGLWRTSRAFREGRATRVVVSQLGPGMVRGDVFASTGTVGVNASLIVCGQMATRILPGAAAVTAQAEWTVADGGHLDLRAEPLIVTSGATYRGRTTIRLGASAGAIVSEIVHCETAASAWTMLTVARTERLAAFDALRIDTSHGSIGTLAIFGPCDRDALDDAAAECSAVRIGIGTLRDGDVLARVVGTTTAVRTALDLLRGALI